MTEVGFVILAAALGAFALALFVAARHEAPAADELSPSLPAPRAQTPAAAPPSQGGILARDRLIAELSGLLARHLNALPVNYREFEDWRALCDDTVKTLTRHNLLPLARAAAERQCGVSVH
jgi:hypothetical protein